MKIHQPFLSLLACASVACLHAEDAPAADPYLKDQLATNIDPQPAGRPNISVCYETFSVPLRLAAKLRREWKNDAGLYTRLTSASAKDGVRQESFDVARCLSSQKVKVECITEELYPTEFEAPELPNTVGVAVSPPDTSNPAPSAADVSKTNPPPAGGGSLPTPGTPTSFQTRNVGRTFEFEATMGGSPANPVVDIRLVPEIISLVGKDAWGQGVSQAEMPRFETQRVNTSMTVSLGRPTLFGTMNRPPDSQADPDSANRVWFAFITVKSVAP